MTDLKNCHDCAVKPGELHKPGCDVERCPRCGYQMISCDCPRDKRTNAWVEKNLMPWTGIWPGTEEAIEFDLWSKWVSTEGFDENLKKVGLTEAFKRLGNKPMGRWEVCTKDTPGATPDLNRLHEVAIWDRKKKRFVKALGIS